MGSHDTLFLTCLHTFNDNVLSSCWWHILIACAFVHASMLLYIDHVYMHTLVYGFIYMQIHYKNTPQEKQRIPDKRHNFQRLCLINRHPTSPRWWQNCDGEELIRSIVRLWMTWLHCLETCTSASRATDAPRPRIWQGVPGARSGCSCWSLCTCPSAPNVSWKVLAVKWIAGEKNSFIPTK